MAAFKIFFISCIGLLIFGSTNIHGQTYVLTYDHIGRILWGDDKFEQQLQNAVELLEKYPEFKIGEDNEAYVYDAFAESNPQLLKKLQQVKERFPDRFGIGSCTYGQPLSTFINEESNIRQLIYAARTNKKYFGMTPPVYAMSEHAMHSQLPQLLLGAGFNGAIMRTHFTMYGYNPSFDAAFGWWVGPDGSKIRCIPTYEGEGFAWPWGKFDNVTKDNNSLTRYPFETDYSLEDFSEEFSKYKPRLASRLDDAALKHEELISELEGNPEFQWVLLEELMDLYPSPVENFHPSANDFITRMPWGYCGNEIWDGCRKSEISVLTAERLAAFEFLAGRKTDQEHLEKAWKNLLVAQHHDIQITGRLDDARKFIAASLSASEKQINSSLEFLTSKLDSEGGIAQITLFNPLSWERTEWIETIIELPQGKAKHIALSFNNEPIPFEYLSLDRYDDGSISSARVRFKKNLPGLSIMAVSVKPANKYQEHMNDPVIIDTVNNKISTDKYIIEFAAGRYIASIKEKSGYKILAKNGFITGTIDGKEYHPDGRWILEGDKNTAVAKQTGKLGPLPFELELTMRNNQQRIDGRLTITCNNQQIGLEHFTHDSKVRFKMFPQLTENVKGIRDLPFMISETDSKWIEGNYWTMLTDDISGLAYFNRGAMGSVHEADDGFSIPFLYSGTYKWGPEYVSGTFTYEFAIYPWAGKIEQQDIHRRALEYEFPVIAMAGQSGNGTLGSVFKPLDLQSDNVILSALYPENGNIIARIYEYKGKGGNLKLQLPSGEKQLIEVDFFGNHRGFVTIPLNFTPWQIRTIIVDNKVSLMHSNW